MRFTWGNGILIFIILFLALCAAFIIFSFQQTNDLEDENYYEMGAEYSKQIDINKRSAVYQDSLSAENLDSTIRLRFSNSIIKMTDSIQIYFYRPSGKKFDYNSKVKIDREISINKSQLAEGRYFIKFYWISNKLDYFIENEIFVK